ncbi:MAG: AIR synthase related protein, partial [Thermoplasmata archaeon]
MKMNEPGKITRSFFNEHIINRVGYKNERILVPPKNGVDIGVISAGEKVLGITTDPFFLDPVYGWEDASWFAFHIIASDLMTSGIRPEFMTVDLNLPLEISDDEIDRMWTVVDSEAKKLKTAIITGHTARYSNTAYPMVGGATMFGFADPDKFVTTEMAEPGDAIVVT